MSIPDECTIKEARIWAALARLGFDSLVLTRRVNFAWITAGGRAISCYGEPDSPVYLVLTRERQVGGRLRHRPAAHRG